MGRTQPGRETGAFVAEHAAGHVDEGQNARVGRPRGPNEEAVKPERIWMRLVDELRRLAKGEELSHPHAIGLRRAARGSHQAVVPVRNLDGAHVARGHQVDGRLLLRPLLGCDDPVSVGLLLVLLVHVVEIEPAPVWRHLRERHARRSPPLVQRACLPHLRPRPRARLVDSSHARPHRRERQHLAHHMRCLDVDGVGVQCIDQHKGQQAVQQAHLRHLELVVVHVVMRVARSVLRPTKSDAVCGALECDWRTDARRRLQRPGLLAHPPPVWLTRPRLLLLRLFRLVRPLHPRGRVVLEPHHVGVELALCLPVARVSLQRSQQHLTRRAKLAQGGRETQRHRNPGLPRPAPLGPWLAARTSFGSREGCGCV
mmetsp:Transcript_24403/g.78731  ORF Transcript_24403/g.78731 Transcript_24403/m.78731 type:complete len:370 (-) Transcript_24403:328-1437(-)|eukprot:scaffold1476_cov115-Isochrysis_galbana.AAC.3